MHSFLTDGVLSLQINVLYVYEEGFKRANDIITRDPQLSSRCPIPTPPVHLIRSRRVVETTPVAKSSSSIHRGESADLPDEAGGDGTTRSPSVSPDGPPRAQRLHPPQLTPSSSSPHYQHAGWPHVTRRLLLPRPPPFPACWVASRHSPPPPPPPPSPPSANIARSRDGGDVITFNSGCLLCSLPRRSSDRHGLLWGARCLTATTSLFIRHIMGGFEMEVCGGAEKSEVCRRRLSISTRTRTHVRNCPSAAADMSPSAAPLIRTTSLHVRVGCGAA